jgi:3-hydroxy-9,10-secoandrosta-1,3,5(10)-triene-9,17-dione monooxygenase reductase component
MRRVPSPVVVITASGAGDARGITIGSFTSLALEPPLVCFNVNRDAQMHGVLADATRYAVHVLSEEQAGLANHFAAPDRTGAEQLEAVPHYFDAHGTPILKGATVRLDCTPHERFVAADKTIFVGRVVDIDTPPDRGAVLYYERTYRGVGEELRSTLLSPVKRASNDTS